MKWLRQLLIAPCVRGVVSCVIVALSLIGCSSGGDNGDSFGRGQPTISAVPDANSVFIAHLNLGDLDAAALALVRYSIAPKPGHFADPIQVTYTRAALEERGLIHIDERRLELPVAGLYSDYANIVNVKVEFADGDSVQTETTVNTGVFVDDEHIYDSIRVDQPVAAGAEPTIDYFYLKSKSGLTIIDVDGEIRWRLPELVITSTIFLGNRFIAGDADKNALYTIELDGSYTTQPMPAGTMITENFHHNFDPGKYGILTAPDGTVDGVRKIESFVTEITPEGKITKEWDLGKIISDYLLANGEDPHQMVEDGVDWFHLNAVMYDPRDDTLLVSSRIHFVMKLDYETGEIIWLFGDPTKDWYVNYPSLRARSNSRQQWCPAHWPALPFPSQRRIAASVQQWPR